MNYSTTDLQEYAEIPSYLQTLFNAEEVLFFEASYKVLDDLDLSTTEMLNEEPCNETNKLFKANNLFDADCLSICPG